MKTGANNKENSGVQALPKLKKGDRLLILQERGQSLRVDRTSEKVARPVRYE